MKYNRRNKAFTLAEVILAIGIMGVGMVFAACLFPAAIKESNASYDDIVGKMVCESGMTIAMAQIEASEITTNTFTTNDNGTILIEPTDASCIPSGYESSPEISNTRFTSVPYLSSGYEQSTDTEKGFVVFCKKTSSDSLCTLAILSYQAKHGENVGGVVLAGNVTNPAQTIYKYTVSSGTPLKGGILFDNGQFARILKVTGNEATLDRQVPTGTNIQAFITNNTTTNLNPTMFGTLTQTGL